MYMQLQELSPLVTILLLLVIASDPTSQYRGISSVLIIGIMSYWITKNLLMAIYLSVGIVLLLQLCCAGGFGIETYYNKVRFNNVFERFENALDNKDNEVQTDKQNESSPVTNKSTDASTTVLNSSADLPDNETVSKYTTKATSANFSELAKAQQETFTMIDSVKQLQDVMKSLTPTLREGKKVIEMMQQLNLHKSPPSN